MNYPIFLPTGAWCIWDTAQQLPLHLGKPWRDIFSELSRAIGLNEATSEMLAALDAPSRWENALREVEKDKGNAAVGALKRRARNGPEVVVRASVIRGELTRDRDQERRDALEAQRGRNISIAKRKKKKQQAASKEVAMVASQEEQEEVKAKVEQVEQSDRPEWQWQSMADLASACGGRDPEAIRHRTKSKSSRWAHYESVSAEKVEGDWHANAKQVYRVRPGYPIHALSDEQQQQLREEVAGGSSDVEEMPSQDDVSTEQQAASPEVNLADKAAQIALLERELAEAREKIVNLETCYNVARETRETWEQRANNTEANHAETSKRVEQLEEELAYQKKQGEGYQNAIGDLVCQVSERDEQIKEWKRRAVEAEHDLDIEGSHLAAIDEALSAAETEAWEETTRHEVIARLVREKNANWQALKRAEDHVEDLEAQLKSTTDSRAYLSTKLAEINGTSKEEVDKAIELLKRTINPKAKRAAIPLEALAGHAVDTIEKQSQRIKELEQQLAAHRDVSSSMVGLEQTSAPDAPIEWQEKLNALGEKTGLIIMKASRQQAEHIEALLSQGFDLVQALEREGVHLPVEARAWLWDVSRVEGAA